MLKGQKFAQSLGQLSQNYIPQNCWTNLLLPADFHLLKGGPQNVLNRYTFPTLVTNEKGSPKQIFIKNQKSLDFLTDNIVENKIDLKSM